MKADILECLWALGIITVSLTVCFTAGVLLSFAFRAAWAVLA